MAWRGGLRNEEGYGIEEYVYIYTHTHTLVRRDVSTCIYVYGYINKYK